MLLSADAIRLPPLRRCRRPRLLASAARADAAQADTSSSRRALLLVGGATVLAAYKFPGPAAATPSSVVDVTPENIDAVLLSEDRVFVEAFAPWCPYCKAMAPLLEALPSRLADAGSSTLVARVDVDAYAALGERFRVTAFPTMLLFQDGKLVGRHVGVATEDALLRYASTVVPVGAAAPVR